MSGRTAGRTSIRGRLGAALGSALLVASLVGSFVPVAAAGPLSITNVDSPDPVQSGAQILYTIVVTNTGGAKVDDIVLTDQINGVVGIGTPPLLDVVSTRGNCLQTNTQITCSAGTIEGRGVWTVTVRGVVTAAAGTTINNIATVVASKSAQTYTTSAAATTQVQGTGPGGPSPDLTIAKNGPLTVTPGGTITYTLTINNLGTADANDVKVTDTIPAGVTITGVTPTSLFTCPTAPFVSNTVECTGGRVNAGQNATITVDGTVALPSGSLENTSVVDPDNTIDEGILGNTADAAERNNFSNTVVTSVSPVPPPVTNAITLDKVGPLSAVPGDSIRYQLHVKNGTLGRADYITLTDGTQGLQAASLHVVSAMASSGTTPQCVVTAPTVACTMTRLAAGGTFDVEIEGMVVASAGSTIINSAAVNANIKNTGYTARDEVQTIINAGIDLTITKSDSPDPVCASSFPPAPVVPPANCRGGLTYTLVVGNSGVKDAVGVVVRDPLPPGTTFDDAATDAANAAIGPDICDEIPPGVVRCVIPLVGAHSTRTIKIVLVAPATLGTITNTATVDPSNAIFESDETNNIAVATTTVATGIDLTIDKVDSPPGFDPIATSGTQTYTITVDNIGTQDVTGVHVRDILPAGTIFLSAEEVDINGALFPGLHGFTCTHDGSATGGLVDCVGGSLLGSASELYFPPAPGNDTATIRIRVFARPTVGIMHNEVRVDPDHQIAEFNETNNIDFEDTTVTTGNAGAGAFNQLRITKTQVDPSVAAGDPDATVATNGTVVYNLHVENLGTDPVSAVVVKDFLPTGSRFISASDTDTNAAVGLSDAFLCTHDGSPTGGTITCTGGAFSGTVNRILEDDGTTFVPTSRDIRVTMFAPNTPGTYPNVAKVDPDNVVPEGNEFDNTSTINTTVTVGGNNLFNELRISKSSVPELQVSTSGVVTYTIIVTNAGSDTAFNVSVRDTLPAGFVYQSASDANPGANAFLCSFNGPNRVECTGAAINGGSSRTITITTLATATPGDWINQALVDPDNTVAEGNETNNAAQDSITVAVGPPPVQYIDLQISKDDNVGASAHVAPNGTIAYVLTVSNAGTQPAFGVVVRDVLPAGVTFVSAQDTTGTPGAFLCSVGSGVVTCTGGVIDGLPGLIGTIGNTRTIRVTVRAPLANTTILNQAGVDPDNTIAEGDETNNVASDTTLVQSNIDLELDKDGPGSASQGTETDYTITVKNLGTQDATGVVVRDPLPIGLIPLGVTIDNADWVCNTFQNPVNLVECTGTLQAGATVTINIHVFVTQDGGTLDNEACVDPDDRILEFSATAGFNPDGNGNNCKTKVTSVVPLMADLQVSKSATPGTVAPGADLKYTITVQNNGTAATQGAVTLTDVLPASVTFQTATATNGWDCTGSTTILCTSPGAVSPGGSTLITIDVTVKTSASAPITNTATVPADAGDGGSIQAETNVSNNTDSVTTNINGSGFDLAIAGITDTPDPANRNEQLVYTVVARNNGSAPTTPADAVVVRIAMPVGETGVLIVGAAGTNGFNCDVGSPAGFPFDCVGDLPAGGETVITVTLDVLNGAPDDLALSATIDPDAAFTESDEANNSDIEATTVSGDTCTVSPCIDLVAAEIFSSPAGPVGGGDSVTYTFGIVNIGDSSTAPAPSENADADFKVTGDFDTATITAPSGWTCAQATTITFPPLMIVPVPGSWHCKGVLGAGAGVVFTIHATAGSVDGSITATGQVDVAAPFIAEFNETNNGPIDVTTIVDVP